MIFNFKNKYLAYFVLFLHIVFFQVYQFYHFHHSEHASDNKLIISVHPISHDSDHQQTEDDHHDDDDLHFAGDWRFVNQGVNSYSVLQDYFFINSFTSFSPSLSYICTIQDFSQQTKSHCYLFHIPSRSPPFPS